MKHSDEAVDKVLAGLRSIDALPGMNHRILEGARARVAQSPQSLWSRLQGLTEAQFRSKGAWSFVSALIIVIAAVPTIHHMMHTSTQTKTQPKLIAPRSNPETAAGRTQAPLVAPLQAATIPQVRRARVIGKKESPVVDDLQVSFPAPPMPLTDQEKLLLRVVHQGDPVEMAMLNPDVRARQNAQGKAEFQQFFEAPPQGDKQ